MRFMPLGDKTVLGRFRSCGPWGSSGSRWIWFKQFSSTGSGLVRVHPGIYIYIQQPSAKPATVPKVENLNCVHVELQCGSVFCVCTYGTVRCVHFKLAWWLDSVYVWYGSLRSFQVDMVA